MEDRYLRFDEEEPPGDSSVLCASKKRIRSTPVSEQYDSDLIRSIPKLTPSFPISSRAFEFRKSFFPDAAEQEWNDWRWQLRNRVKSTEQLKRFLELSEEEEAAISMHSGLLPLAVTPYYLSLFDRFDPDNPLRMTAVPVLEEYVRSTEESQDPLGEEADSPVPGIVHRYPDRVLFLVTHGCLTHCRYCTRSRMIETATEFGSGTKRWEGALSYIADNRAIRDVLISGGDPLVLSDYRLEWLLKRLRAIPHVEIIRIGSKAPAVAPQRVTPSLTRTLRKFHPLWMSLHFTHPDELTPESAEACRRLADAGIPLGSQTVLLKGINDSLATMRALFQGLLRIRVRPYYLYQCDPINGSSHFRTAVSQGIEIIRGLRGFTTGYAVPTYVIDAPGGGGKVPVSPDYVVGRDGDELVLNSYDERSYRYPDSQRAPAGGRQ